MEEIREEIKRILAAGRKFDISVEEVIDMVHEVDRQSREVK